MQEIILNVKKNPGTKHLGCLRQHEKSKYEEEEQRMKKRQSQRQRKHLYLKKVVSIYQSTRGI